MPSWSCKLVEATIVMLTTSELGEKVSALLNEGVANPRYKLLLCVPEVFLMCPESWTW